MGLVLFKLLAVSEGTTHLKVSGVLSSLPSDWRAEDLAAPIWTPYLGTLKVLLSSTSDLLNSLAGTRAGVCVSRISDYCHLHPCFFNAFEFFCCCTFFLHAH